MNIFQITDHISNQLGAERMADVIRDQEDALVAVKKIVALIDFASGVLTPSVFQEEIRKWGYNVECDESAIENRKN